MSLTLDSSQIVLTALAAGGENTEFDPMQIQHLLFLIDRVVPDHVDGPHFAFAPGSFGPFDETAKEVVLDLCHEGGLNRHVADMGFCYVLTPWGFRQGSDILARLDPSVTAYLKHLVAWTLALDFRQRLSILQAHYPDMVPNWDGSMSDRFKPTSARRRWVQAYANRSSIQSVVQGLARMTDWRGTLSQRDRTLRVLREARREVSSMDDVWLAVGDDLREAMALYACGDTDRLTDHEPSRVA